MPALVRLIIHATFDGTDPKLGPVISSADIDAPNGATRLRAVAEVNGQFGEEESAPLQTRRERSGRDHTANRPALKLDAPATLTSRFEPKDTAAAFSALDRLAKTPERVFSAGSVEVNGGRSEAGLSHAPAWAAMSPFWRAISMAL